MVRVRSHNGEGLIVFAFFGDRRLQSESGSDKMLGN